MDILGLIDIPLWLLLLAVLAVCLYIYGQHPFSVWSRLGVPGPPPTIFVGHILELFKPEGNKAAYEKWQAQYGRLYGVYNFRRPLLVVTDLEVLREILVKDFNNFSDRFFFGDGILLNREVRTGVFMAGGNTWKRIRSIITPTFSSGKLKMLTQHINTCSARLADNFVHSAVNGQLVDVKRVFGAFNMDVITSTAFGVQVDSQKNMDEPLVKHGSSLFTYGKYFELFCMAAGLFPEISYPIFRLFNIGFFKQDDMLFFDKTISQMIQDRKNDPKDNSNLDFLQLMMNAEADSSEIAAGGAKKLTREEIVAQGLIFFIAGYETLSTALQFLSYELARNQEVQQKLISEIDRVVGADKPTYEHCQSLKYMDAVIKETLRMYPPLSQITRLAAKDITLKDFKVPAGAGIMIPVYNIGRDPEYFPNPNTFDPERFSGSSEYGSFTEDMNSLTFLSFGYGPRLCLGMRLAMLEMKLSLAHVLRRVTFTKSMPHEVDVIDLTSLLKPTLPIMIQTQMRDEQA